MQILSIRLADGWNDIAVITLWYQFDCPIVRAISQ